MLFDLVKTTPTGKLYWNDHLKRWVKSMECSTPLTKDEAPTPLPANTKLEPVFFDAI